MGSADSATSQINFPQLSLLVSLAAVVGLLCGGASAIFLYSLELATQYRVDHSKLVFALPFAGLVIGSLYQWLGRSVIKGSNQVIDSAYNDEATIPLRMAPLVLIGTVLTHLFGGSAGREGTAVQIGASLADNLLLPFKRLGWSSAKDEFFRHSILVSGVAGGFSSVFGTPIAGLIFAMEYLFVGRVRYVALLPALIAALIGDLTTRALGIGHAHYPQVATLPLDLPLLLKWIAFSIAVALSARSFIFLTHKIKNWCTRLCPHLGLRMMLGGVIIVIMWQALGSSDYLGLGVPMILSAFENADQPQYAFLLKLLFTAVTLGTGYLGGEVTPLFFVGATLGNTMAHLLNLPLELGAGVGLAAVFAACSNTPLALSIMAVELLGGGALPHVAIVCFFSYLMAGHGSIYHSQRIRELKSGKKLDVARRLSEL